MSYLLRGSKNQMTRKQWLKFGVGGIAVAVLAARFLGSWSMIGKGESDFSIYLGAARHLAEGSTPWTQAGYLYPPLTAILVMPLSGLGYVAARKAWFLLMAAVLVATAMILGRVIGTSRGGVVVALVFLAVMGNLEENLVLGQPNPLILFFLVVSLWAAQRRKTPGEGLGIGVAAPKASWGSLASDGIKTLNPIASPWWLTLFPCLMLAVTLLSLNLIGDGLRDAFDPQLRRRK